MCGVRGSTPAPGAEFVRYGGHTSCLVFAHDGERPSLIVDAGTGIRRASDLFGASEGLFNGSPFDGAILLSHLHWDHAMGLPFFAAGNSVGSRVDLYVPAQIDTEDHTEEIVGQLMSPPHFPIAPAGLLGAWQFLPLETGETKIEGFSVVALEIPHIGGRTFGYRISDGRSSVAYLSDHCPTRLGKGPDGLGEYHDSALTLSSECDLLFHDAQYLDEELDERARFGHAACGYAVRLASAAVARRVMLFHHDPVRTDQEIDSVVARYQGGPVPVEAAAVGMVIDLP